MKSVKREVWICPRMHTSLKSVKREIWISYSYLSFDRFHLSNRISYSYLSFDRFHFPRMHTSLRDVCIRGKCKIQRLRLKYKGQFLIFYVFVLNVVKKHSKYMKYRGQGWWLHSARWNVSMVMLTHMSKRYMHVRKKRIHTTKRHTRTTKRPMGNRVQLCWLHSARWNVSMGFSPAAAARHPRC